MTLEASTETHLAKCLEFCKKIHAKNVQQNHDLCGLLAKTSESIYVTGLQHEIGSTCNIVFSQSVVPIF